MASIKTQQNANTTPQNNADYTRSFGNGLSWGAGSIVGRHITDWAFQYSAVGAAMLGKGVSLADPTMIVPAALLAYTLVKHHRQRGSA